MSTDPVTITQAAAPVLVNPYETEKAPHHRQGFWQKFVSWIWDSDYYEKSEAERKLVLKLDCTMLTAITLGWWIKNLDQSNLANAYVSGMKEDLYIDGNQYTYMLTIYAAVVAAMQIPSNFIALKVRPSWFLAGSEIGWTIFTFAQAGAQSYQAMYGFRFAVAFFESFYYPVAFFILGSWYTKPELAKRISLFFVAGPAGSAFSGYMQAGIYSSMNGLHGLAGWRWLFLVCGMVSFPFGILLFFMVPDFPETTKAWYLSQDEIQLARDRVARNGTAKVTRKIDKRVIYAALRSWKFWLLVPWYTWYSLPTVNGRQFGIYLRAYGYDVTMRNVLPACASLITIPTLLIYAYLSDRTVDRGRSWVIGIICTFSLFPVGVLAIWPESNSLRVAAFLINASTYVTPVFFAWVAEICQGATEQRAFITGAITCFWYTTDAWLPTIIFLQTDGPRFKKGFISAFVFAILAAASVPLIHVLQQRDKRMLTGTTDEEVKVGPIEDKSDQASK